MEKWLVALICNIQSKCKQKLMGGRALQRQKNHLWPVMVRGRPRKRARNTAGLQNRAPSKSTLNSPERAPTPKDNPGFNVSHLRAKCSPVCPFESQSCCMARLLSQQDDFMNQPSMLETLITSAGHKSVFLPKFHCELNTIEMVSSLANTLCTSIMLTRSYYQYWGWCKYRYREEDKKDFQAAKDAAVKYLNACPTDVIRRFINRAWRFMSAYRLGLTGKAAKWAVQKQRQHRQVSHRAMMSIDAVLNLN